MFDSSLADSTGVGGTVGAADMVAYTSDSIKKRDLQTPMTHSVEEWAFASGDARRGLQRFWNLAYPQRKLTFPDTGG